MDGSQTERCKAQAYTGGAAHHRPEIVRRLPAGSSRMFQESLDDIVPRLEEARSLGLLEHYALIGGLAVSFWAEPRATQDLDFAVAVGRRSPHSLATFLHGTYRPGEPDDPLQGVVLTSGGKDEHAVPVQLVFLPRLLSDLVLEEIHTAMLLGCSVPVVAWERLVLLKLYAGGPRDLLDAKQILDTQSPNAAALAALDALAQRADLTDEWEQFLRRAGMS